MIEAKNKISPATKIQGVTLRVNSLDRMLNFYADTLGFKLIERKDGSAQLSADGNYPALIGLTEDRNARQSPRRSAGLYHTAFRFPDRKELARIFTHLFNMKVKFQGFSDHLVSEAIYLSDPEGNGIELYADRPREQWKWHDGEVAMATEHLNLADLVKELQSSNGSANEKFVMAPRTDLGHIHIKTTGLENAEKFYHEILGLDITTKSYEGALFFSAGGYHHHIGTNVWTSLNGAKASDDSAGLNYFTIQVPDGIEEMKRRLEESKVRMEETEEGFFVRDFDNIKILLL